MHYGTTVPLLIGWMHTTARHKRSALIIMLNKRVHLALVCGNPHRSRE